MLGMGNGRGGIGRTGAFAGFRGAGGLLVNDLLEWHGIVLVVNELGVMKMRVCAEGDGALIYSNYS